jgi:hypothetical protein
MFLLWVGVFFSLTVAGVQIISHKEAIDLNAQMNPSAHFRALALVDKFKGINAGNAKMIPFEDIDSFKRDNPNCTFALKPFGGWLHFGNYEGARFAVEQQSPVKQEIKLSFSRGCDPSYSSHYEVENEIIRPIGSLSSSFRVLALVDKSKRANSSNAKLLPFEEIDSFVSENPNFTYYLEPYGGWVEFTENEGVKFDVERLSGGRLRIQLDTYGDDNPYSSHYEVDNEVIYPIMTPPSRFRVLALCDKSEGVSVNNAVVMPFDYINSTKRENPNLTFDLEPFDGSLQFARFEGAYYSVKMTPSGRKKIKLYTYDDDNTYISQYEIENEVVYPTRFRMRYFGYMFSAAPFAFLFTISFYICTKILRRLIRKKSAKKKAEMNAAS